MCSGTAAAPAAAVGSAAAPVLAAAGVAAALCPACRSCSAEATLSTVDSTSFWSLMLLLLPLPAGPCLSPPAAEPAVAAVLPVLLPPPLGLAAVCSDPGAPPLPPAAAARTTAAAAAAAPGFSTVGSASRAQSRPYHPAKHLQKPRLQMPCPLHWLGHLHTGSACAEQHVCCQGKAPALKATNFPVTVVHNSTCK